MNTKWQMQDAKARFAELVRKAGTEGPQVVTYRGEDAAVVLSIEDYKRMQSKTMSLLDYLRAAPELDDETISVINDRSKEPGTRYRVLKFLVDTNVASDD
jgi:prevent-host-death family protein